MPAAAVAAQLVEALAGGMRVADVAREVGYSRRHLGSLFRAECGVTPKEYQRIARFERSRQRLAQAVRCGVGTPTRHT